MNPRPQQFHQSGDAIIFQHDSQYFPLEWPLDFPPKAIVRAERNQERVFCYNDLVVSLLGVQHHATHCQGQFCDKQNLITSDNRVREKCACDTMQNKEASGITFVFDLLLNTPDGGFNAQFSSQSFFLNFVSKSLIPLHVTWERVNNDDDILDGIEEAAQRAFQLGNNNGGWKAIGWYKYGMTELANADQPLNAFQGSRLTGESPNVKPHIVRLEPMNPSGISINDLESIKYECNIR